MDNFSGFTASGILNEIQNMIAELKCEPEQFQGRIIYMSIQRYGEFFECCNICQNVSVRTLVILGTWL